jgi:hypothetical protein
LAKLLIAAQPVRITAYVLTPKNTNNLKDEYETLITLPSHARIILQIKTQTENNNIGLKTKRALWLSPLLKNCFIKSLTPSITGCKIPKNLTLLGPKRV